MGQRVGRGPPERKSSASALTGRCTTHADGCGAEPGSPPPSSTSITTTRPTGLQSAGRNHGGVMIRGQSRYPQRRTGANAFWRMVVCRNPGVGLIQFSPLVPDAPDQSPGDAHRPGLPASSASAATPCRSGRRPRFEHSGAGRSSPRPPPCVTGGSRPGSASATPSKPTTLRPSYGATRHCGRAGPSAQPDTTGRA